MLRSLFVLFTVACAETDLHLLQMSAARQNPKADGVDEQDLEIDEPVVDGPPLTDEELENGEDGSPDDPPSVDGPDDPALLQDQMVLEDHIALDMEDDSDDDDAEVDADQLPGMDSNGVYPDQRPQLKRGDIRGFLPNVDSVGECQCEGLKRKGIGTASILYHRGIKRCLFLRSSVNFNNRIGHRGWAASQQLVCRKTMKWYQVPKSCDGKRGFEHAKCSKIRAAAAYTWGSWRSKKNCFLELSGGPKMYDWEQAKTYCLTGNSYCNGIAKKTVRLKGKYVNQYTFCKPYQGRFVVGNMPRTWPYGGVMEVRHKPRVELSDDEFAKYR